MSQNKNQIKNNSSLLWLGTIVNTHSLKGEIKILSNSDDFNYYFKKNNKIYLKDNDSIIEYTIKNSRLHKKFILLFLEGINTFEQAVKLKNNKIYIKEETLTEDDFYFKDVLGAKVINNKKEIGIVESYYDQKAYYSFHIKGEKNSFNIPIIDNFIVKFDKKNKILYVKIPKDFY